MSVERRRNPSGTIVYRVRWREHGRARARTFDRRRDAELFDSEQRRNKALGLQLTRDETTLHEYAARWLPRQQDRLAHSTLVMYRHQLEVRILPWLGHFPVRELDAPLVRDWLARVGKDSRPPSVQKAATVLSAILTEATEDGLLQVSPVRQVRKPARARDRDPVMIPVETVEEVRAHMIDAGDEHGALLVALLAYTGARPESEALPLTWAGVGAKAITLRATKRGGKRRQVTLLPPLAQDLREWRMRQGNPRTGLVIPRVTGGAWTDSDWDNWRNRHWQPAAKAAGLPPGTRPRDLRSSFASLLIFAGWNVIAVADQLGHSVTTLLKVYAGLFAEYDPAERVDPTARIMAAREAIERRRAA